MTRIGDTSGDAPPGDQRRPSRRAVLAVLGGTGSIGLAGCGSGDDPDRTDPPTCSGDITVDLPPADGIDEWPVRSHDGAGTNYAPNASPSELSRLWTVTPSDLPAGEAVDGNRGLLWHRFPPVLDDGELYVGTETGVHALDPASGSHRWSVDATLAGGFPFAVAGSVLLTASSPRPGGDPDRLVAVDRSARSVRWTRPFDANGAAPLVTGDAVYAVRAASFARLDASSGEIRGDPLALPDDLEIVDCAADGDAVCAVSDEAAVALDADSGDVRWTRRPEDLPVPVGEGDRSFAYVLVGPDRVYCHAAYTPPAYEGAVEDRPTTTGTMTGTAGHGDVVFAFDRESGERVWTYPAGDALVTARLVLADGTLFLGGMRDHRLRSATASRGFLAAVDATEGCRRWHVEPFEGQRRPEGAVTGAGGTLFATAIDRDLRSRALLAVDAADGSVLARHRHDDVENTSPAVVADDRAYLTVDPGEAGSGAEIRAYGDGDG